MPLGDAIESTLDANNDPAVATSVEQATGGTAIYAIEALADGQERPTVRRRNVQGAPAGTGASLVTIFGWTRAGEWVTAA